MEWRDFEPRMLEALGNGWKHDQIEIRMYRGEHKQALVILSKMGYPSHSLDGVYGGIIRDLCVESAGVSMTDSG